MITEKSNRLQVIVITDYDYPISGTGSTQEDLSRHDWNLFDWDVKNQIKQKQYISMISNTFVYWFIFCI